LNYQAWLETVPDSITNDLVWKMKAYRLALFAADVGWRDVARLDSDRRTLGLSDQLYRALGSISANVAEGYSRRSGKDRSRFYEYALGSARESRDWFTRPATSWAKPLLNTVSICCPRSSACCW